MQGPTHGTSAGQFPFPTWRTTRFAIDLSRPQVMGIVNLTPDSFSDGGQHADAASGIRHCAQLVREGADILDLGAESTRPGSPPVPLAQERERLMPVLREAVKLGVPVSVDTYKSEVMREALDLGADIVNDIWALRQPGALDAVAAHPACGVCLMHMHGEPGTMQKDPQYRDVVAEVGDFLVERVNAARELGIAAQRLCIDPGFGFGKTLNQGRSIGLGSSDPRLKRFGFGLKSRQRGSRIVRQFSLTLAVGHQSFSLRGQVCNPPVKCRAFGAQGGQLMPRFIGSVARGNGTGAQIAHCPHGLCLIGGGGPLGFSCFLHGLFGGLGLGLGFVSRCCRIAPAGKNHPPFCNANISREFAIAFSRARLPA